MSSGVLRIRRPQYETRVEIMPLIDVVFLLLTFFIYAMVLMVRAELLPVNMQHFESGETATVKPAVSITIDAHGALFLNRDPVSLDEVLERLELHRATDPNTIVYVAAEAVGTVDRLPVFLGLYDKLNQVGLDVRLVGSNEPEPLD